MLNFAPSVESYRLFYLVTTSSISLSNGWATAPARSVEQWGYSTCIWRACRMKSRLRSRSGVRYSSSKERLKTSYQSTPGTPLLKHGVVIGSWDAIERSHFAQWRDGTHKVFRLMDEFQRLLLTHSHHYRNVEKSGTG